MKELCPSPAQVAVLGLGYVGCVTAACLAKLGHTVVGVDPDQFKVDSVNQSSAPFYEPDLAEIIRDVVAAGRLRATVRLDEALADAEIALICVGTPSERNGNLGLATLRTVSEQIGALLPQRSKSLIVVVRSTVFPGTCEEVVLPALGNQDKAAIVANPEFLREGTAVQDFMYPSLLVAGGTESRAVERIASLYAGLPVEPCLVSLRTAEMIKYACNCFHAVKISFANEIGALCEQLGVSGTEVMETVCRDRKLNISAAYMKPGFAFGGSCLPKDLRALTYRASRLDLTVPMLESVLPSNDEHLRRAIHNVLEHGGQRLGIFGLAFKEDTDDVRESPTVGMIEYLVGKGRDVRVFDPHIELKQLYGSNRNFLLSSIPHIGRLMQPGLEDVLGWADTVVVAQKPDERSAARIASAGCGVIDLVGSGLGASALAQPI